jgi:hypothetical protein
MNLMAGAFLIYERTQRTALEPPFTAANAAREITTWPG